MSFVERYGPWALVAGASEGVGSRFAEALAERGLNVVLLARRHEVLERVAADIQRRHGVRTRTLAIDLATPDAATTITAAVEGLEIGFLVYCAGADPNYEPFLKSSLATAEAMLDRNCAVPMRLCHRLAEPMVERGRGAIVLFGSGAGFVGAPNMAVYTASKAFDMVFAESLWTELKPHGVDVLGLILGETDTPALRRLRHERGLAGPDDPAPGAATVDEVVAEAFAHLTKGPTRLAHKRMRRGLRVLYPIPRNALVRLTTKLAAKAMGPTD
ncbi:SDR family NAD(P)-dependent oxidoreductase [Nocardia bovistercoris]|uniref:SDR family NAD(P)-dependent oxidoreductase n=1 Tax=Nocardia bovistercoris TaxID=2785916 RepID=A0A931IA19_9NOCA|nr:SDR family NAD(P)-dependent oxidoreductase [Nocardia bovistercoris]MBH0776625.1 SDR family NAD(P)-dependent oxidoreductase [Nocardia bovistercoris]